MKKKNYYTEKLIKDLEEKVTEKVKVRANYQTIIDELWEQITEYQLIIAELKAGLKRR